VPEIAAVSQHRQGRHDRAKSGKSHCRTGADTARLRHSHYRAVQALSGILYAHECWLAAEPAQSIMGWTGHPALLEPIYGWFEHSVLREARSLLDERLCLSSGVVGNTRPIRALAKRQWALISFPALIRSNFNGGKQHVEQDVLP